MGDTQIERPQPWILVTNDDGVDSPALPPLLAALAGLGPVRTVVPDGERSWTSKALSRFGRPRLRPAPQLPGQAWTLEGLPADCASVGVHNLASTPPGLVVSGINIGANAGLSFLLSSGTVGAAVEAFLNGVPAVAFSVQLQPEVYGAWRQRRDAAPVVDICRRAAEVAGDITAEILAGGLPTAAQVVSVNFPQEVQRHTPRVLTGVTQTRYGPFFRSADDGRLEHVFNGQQPAAEGPDGDLEALERGLVSITPLRFALEAPATAADRQRFERP